MDLKELATLLVRQFQLHEGRYQLAIGFRLGVGPVPGPEGSQPVPGAMMGVENIGLIPAPDDAKGPNIIEAAQVNPAPKAGSRPRKKATGK